MRKFGLILSFVASVCTTTFGQTDLAAINRPIELLNDANHDIEEGNYETAVQKLIASIRLNPQQREAYMSLNTACSYTNQVTILKSYLIKAKEIFKEDDELCYYLGNIYQNENNIPKAIQEYSNAIKYSKQNGEDFELVYAYYQNRASCYLKQSQYAQAINDYNNALKLNQENGATYANRGIAFFKIGKRAEAIKDWRKAVELGVTSASVYLKRYAR